MRPSGPIPANIVIVGEAPGSEEERVGLPFIGPSGNLLNSLLRAAGIERDSCFVSNVCNVRPPGNDISLWVSDNKSPPSPGWVHIRGKWVDPRIASGLETLQRHLAEVRPNIVIALGNVALWALTGNSGISKWRGSRLSPPDFPFTVVPTYHPAAILRDDSLKNISLLDLKRAKAIHDGTQIPRVYQFKIAPTFEETKEYLLGLLSRADTSDGMLLSGDLETRGYHIACFGIAESANEAFCIPFLEQNLTNPFYWPLDQEAEIIHLIIRLFLHPQVTWVGQNFLYDCQYFHRFWGAVPLKVWDTMIGHHSVYSNLRKGLDFLSSMYAQDHIYWKDEIKNWEESIGEKQFWTYNCKDACITWEIWHEIQSTQAERGVSENFLFQQSLFFPVLRMMNRGVRVDSPLKIALRRDLQEAARDRQDKLDYVCNHPLNPKSSVQLKKFFYEDLKLSGIRSMEGDKLTLNSPALATLAGRYPTLKPVFQLIAELRSIGVFLSTFIDAKSDSDGRMRCSFSIAGPTTFRFSSSENAFGSGMNLQNIPVAEKQKIKGGGEYVKLPNIRKLFIPDPGYTFFDMDLDRADLQVVVWEADDADLKKALSLNLDMHCVNACDIFDIKGIPYEELREDHPNYRDHRGRIGEAPRNKAKMGVHATNYGVGDYKLAVSLGITQREAGIFRARWFGAHPGVKAWHLRTEQAALQQGYITNPFGAKFHILGRFDLPECLAWQPQSTVARVINTALINIDAAEQRGETSIQLLGQCHDSLFGQFLTPAYDLELQTLKRLSRVPVPYPEPLIIPVGINCSTQSWGACK